MFSRSSRQARKTLLATFVSAFIASFSLSLIPFTDGVGRGENNTLAYVIALAFWMGIVFVFVFSSFTKKHLKRYREKLIIKGTVTTSHLPGIFSFSKKKESLVVYAMFLIGLIVIVTDMFFGYVHEAVMFPVISVTLFAFILHCVLDGKYYEVYILIKEGVKNETTH